MAVRLDGDAADHQFMLSVPVEKILERIEQLEARVAQLEAGRRTRSRRQRVDDDDPVRDVFLEL